MKNRNSGNGLFHLKQSYFLLNHVFQSKFAGVTSGCTILNDLTSAFKASVQDDIRRRCFSAVEETRK